MKRTKKRSSKRRRVGAASLNPKSPVVMLAAAAVGFLASDYINQTLVNMIPVQAAPTPAVSGLLNSDNIMYGQIGLGAALLLMKGKPSIIKTGAGGILAGSGLKAFLKKQGVISGYQNVPVLGRAVRGYQNTPVIGNTGKMPAALSGGYRVNGVMPAELSGGFRVNGKGSKVMGCASDRGGSGMSRN